jgi:uncharacterized membrane protein YtjA (UPF0391 family)
MARVFSHSHPQPPFSPHHQVGSPSGSGAELMQMDRVHQEEPAGAISEEALMANFGLLHYAIVFLVVAVIAAAVGFGGVAGIAMEGARLLFWVFIVLFVVSLIASLIRRRT